jgi:alpha-tubulin suppressor-like RCC1 family protein
MSPALPGPFRPRSTAVLVALVVTLGCNEDPAGPSDSPPPAALALSTAGVLFRQVSVGLSHACGVSTTNLGYCWGRNDLGQLGDGTTTPHGAPGLVAGNLRFKHIYAGWDHSCGVTTENRVYCWGYNFDGQVGDGTGYPISTKRLSPVPVGGPRRFTQVRTGQHYTCAIEAVTEAAFCWGYNVFGQLGNGDQNTQWRPVRVKGGLHFRQISTGIDHSCGVTTDSRGYCWGQNFWGQYGNGTTIPRLQPTRAGGALRFTNLQAGRYHTCGLTTGQRVHCWGMNQDGQLGDGTTTDHITPKPVAGGLRFDHLTTQNSHVCAVTPEDLAYCWGDNMNGAIGDGTISNDRLVPTAVAGGLRFSGVWAGQSSTYALSPAGRAYRWGGSLLLPTPLD